MLSTTPSGRTVKYAARCGAEQQWTPTATSKQPPPASGSAAGSSCSNCIRRRSRGTRALVELLAAAVLVQFVALAGGGSWLLLRLSALEARHEQIRASGCACPGAAAPAQLPGNEYREALASGHGSGGGAAAAADADAVGDVTFGHQQRRGDSWSRFAWKRSAIEGGSGTQGVAMTTANPATEAAAAEQLADESGQHGLAHFVFRNPRDDEFQLDAGLTKIENYTTMVPIPGYTARELSNDRWYPRMLRYHAASGRLVFLARAPWLDQWSGDATAQANSRGEIAASQEGLYMIYAQVCFTNRLPQVMGFVIKKRTVPTTGRGTDRGGEGLGHGEHRRDEYIAACETNSQVGAQPEPAMRRYTCSVTTMHHLTPQDRLTIELHSARHIFVRHDFTYVGLVRMA